MATILELKSTIAGILGVTVADFTVNGIDFGLAALNAVRLHAEQGNDFEFQRKTLSLSVNTLTGGSLDDAVIQGTSTSATIKTLIDVGQADTNGNFVPLEWTTSAESHERTRGENRYGSRALRYPSDADYQVYVGGRRRVMLDGSRVRLFPMGTVSENVTVLFDAYVYSNDWSAAGNTLVVTGSSNTDINVTYYPFGVQNGHPFWLSVDPTVDTPQSGTKYAIWFVSTGYYLSAASGMFTLPPSSGHFFPFTGQSPVGASTVDYTLTGPVTIAAANGYAISDIWTTKGYNYLLWASVVWLNQNCSTFGKQFVARTEGNLAPPTQLANEALAALIASDTNKYELFRRHGR